MKMFTLFQLVVSKGIEPKGVNTDCIFVSDSASKLEKLFHFDASVIGGLKLETGKHCANRKLRQHKNVQFVIEDAKINQIKIKDEYDNNEFKNIFDKMTGGTMLTGEYPGAGKSTVVKNYGIRQLFVVPGNVLALENRAEGFDAITVNMLLGIFGEGKEYVKMKPHDVSPYDCICFDEIMMHAPKMLHRIALFMKKYPDKKFFSTGDTDQLQPIDFKANNVPNKQKYLFKCVQLMFGNHIHLRIAKRLETEEQRESLRLLKRDIFNPAKNVMTTFKEHGFRITVSPRSHHLRILLISSFGLTR